MMGTHPSAALHSLWTPVEPQWAQAVRGQPGDQLPSAVSWAAEPVRMDMNTKPNFARPPAERAAASRCAEGHLQCKAVSLQPQDRQGNWKVQTTATSCQPGQGASAQRDLQSAGNLWLAYAQDASRTAWWPGLFLPEPLLRYKSHWAPGLRGCRLQKSQEGAARTPHQRATCTSPAAQCLAPRQPAQAQSCPVQTCPRHT